MKPTSQSVLVAYHRLQALAEAENDRHLRLEQAKVAVNWVAGYGETDVDTALDLYTEIRHLAAADASPGLREQQAKIITNWIAECAALRPETARALYDELRLLAAEFADEAELTVQRAKAAANLTFAAGECHDLDLGAFAFRELSRIVDDHADKPEIKAVVEHVSRMFDVGEEKGKDD